jgi:short-subunit dehydrogenase involved in D-alanine esterification of teichoic acids
MVTVAIAGGTGGIGRTIAEVVKANQNHKVIILSRKVCSSPESQPAEIWQ